MPAGEERRGNLGVASIPLRWWLVWWWVDAVYAAGAEAFGGAGFIRLVGAHAQEQFLEEGTRVVSPSPEEDIRWCCLSGWLR